MVAARKYEKWEKKMKKEFTIENWILGGTSFILIFTFGCYLWFQSEMSSIDNYFNDHTVETQQSDETSETDKLETPLIEIDDKEDSDTYHRNNSVIDHTDTEISDVSATKSDYIDNDKATVPIPWGKQTAVLKIFNLNI